MAELFAFDFDIANIPRETLVRQLETLLKASDDLEPALRVHLSEIINIMQRGDSEYLRALLMMFLPLPLPYRILELDEEFEKDEIEIKRENQNDDKDEDADSDERNQKEKDQSVLPSITYSEDETASEFSLSIYSFNYGKMHFLFKHDPLSNAVKLNVKADSKFDDLSLAIELALEDALATDADSYSAAMSLWDEDISRYTESRDLKLRFEGALRPLVLKSALTLVETVYKADDIVEADYKVL